MGREMAEKLGLNGVHVRFVTTDGDGRGAQGMAETIQDKNPAWEVVRQADPVHIRQSQFNRCFKSQFSRDMFGQRTIAGYKKAKLEFSKDVKSRC